MLTDINFYENSNIKFLSDSIVINHIIETEDEYYKTKIIYENNPIKLRKVKLTENNQPFEIGLYNYNDTNHLSKEFFSLINPYLTN